MIKNMMNETWRCKYTRDRSTAGNSKTVPTGCEVTNVLRIENHKAYSKLRKLRTLVKKKRKTTSDGAESSEIPTDYHVETRKFPIWKGALDREANEVHLFHGTNPEAADLIAKGDFKIDKAGSNRGTMFGPGVYLAENASKSDEYAKEGGGIFTT